jgi:hypothetical protein
MKSYVSLVVCLLMILTSVVVATADLEPTSTNYWGFSTPTSVHKTLSVGSTFTTTIWVNVHQRIDTAAVENMTFTPGVVNYTSAVIGNLFSSSLISMTPTHLNNVQGYAEPMVSASDVPVNSTNGTLSTITWTMRKCGKVDFAITDGGTAYAGTDVPVIFIPFSIWVHPADITGLSATKVDSTEIALSWTKHAGDDRTVIRGSTSTYPTTPTGGTWGYNGTGTATSQTGLSTGQTWYYSAWGWNETTHLYTLTYVTASATTDRSPVFGIPSPANNSVGRPTAFTWSIPITDPDDDSIDWTIECNNSQSNSGSGAGGTKTLYLTGLKLNTTYTIWVNATQGEFDIHAWYRFTTTKTTAPVGGGGGVAPQEINTVTISVIHSGIPVNATIRINAGTSLQNMGTLVDVKTTGIDGIYAFGLADGTYILTVTASGYTTYQKVLVVTQDATELVVLQSAGQFPWWWLFIIALLICLLLYYFLSKNKKKEWYRKL